MSENQKPQEQPRATERESKDLKAIEHVLSLADTRLKTDLDKAEMKRTVANASHNGAELRILNPEAAHYRDDAEEVAYKEIESYEALQAKSFEKMAAKLAGMETVQKLVEEHYDKVPDAVKVLIAGFFGGDPKEFLKTTIETNKNNLNITRAENEKIQAIIKDGEDKNENKKEIANQMLAVWPDLWTNKEGKEEIPSFNGAVDAATSRDFKLRAAKMYATKIAIRMDELTKTIESKNFENIVMELEKAALLSDQDQRDLLLDQQKNRAQFLTRISGTPKGEQLINEAIIDFPDTTGISKTKKKINVRYLAYCIRYAADLDEDGNIKRSAAEQLKEVQDAIDTDEDFMDPPETEEEKKALAVKIDAYLKKVIALENPAGIDPKNLLLRMNIDKNVVDTLATDQDLMQHVPLRTLLLFKGLQVDDKPLNLENAIFEILENNKITKEDFINILTFLRYQVNAGDNWEKVKENAKTNYETMLKTKALKEDPTDGIVTYVGKTREERWKISGHVDALLKELTTDKTFKAENMALLKQIAKEVKIDLPWEKDAEFMVAPIAAVAEKAFEYWSKYIYDIPKDFEVGDKENEKWRQAEEKSRLLSGAAAALNSVIELQPKDANGKLIERNEEEIINKATKDIQKNRGELLEANDPSTRVLAQHADAADAVKISRYVHNELQRLGALKTHPMEQQDIAFWLAMHVNMTTALDYLNGNPPDILTLNLTQQQILDLKRYTITLNLNEQTRGVDVLLLMKNKLGLQVNKMAYALLQETKDQNGVPLSAGPARMEEWLRSPQNAGPALQTILIGNDETKAAFIQAFITNTQQQYQVEGGSFAPLNPAEVRGMVETIMLHLQRQKLDAVRSSTHSQKKERFNDPLDIIRSGKDTLFGMLHSGDRVQQGLAITMMVASGFILYRTWTKGGAFGKGLALSVPLFFGSDAMLRKMTGKGVMDRLGLQYMDEKDRGTAIEQFMREYEKQDKYAFLKAPAGQTAMRALTDSNSPESKIPVADLVQWRLNMNANATGGFQSSMPQTKSLKNAAVGVKGKLTDLEKKSLSTKQEEEKAAEYLYLAFDALCMDIAERNNLPEPKAVNGARLIKERYVDCTDETAFGDNTAAVQKIAQQRGGFTMLDVLVYERPTAVAGELLRQNDTLVEWLMLETGYAIDEAKSKLKQNIAQGQVYLEHGMQIAPEYFEKMKMVLGSKAAAIYEVLRLICVKNYAALKAEAYAALNFMSNTLAEIGIIITENGPNAIKWTWETGTYAGRKTIDALQNAYRMMHANGLITGPLIDFFDRIALAVAGVRLTDLVLYESAMETDDPKKQNEHVEALTEEKRWKGDFLRQLNTATTGIKDAQMDEWIAAARKATGVGVNANGYRKMVAYELVKRKVYSYILQNRLKDASLDMTNVTYETIEKGNDHLDSMYGIISLQILGTEKNRFDIKNWGLPNFVGTPLEVILNYIPHATIERKDARQYLTALDEYYTHFRRRAEAAFPDKKDEDKLKMYDAFLQTVLTNAVLDMTLSAAAGKEELNAHILPRDKTLPTPVESEPFYLKIEQAQNFLTYLRAERGNSATIENLKDTDFSAFKQGGNLGDLAIYIPKTEEELSIAPAEAGPLDKNSEHLIDVALDDPSPKNLSVLQKMLEGNTVAYHRRGEIVQRFNDLADEYATTPLKDKAKESLVILQGASRRESLRHALINSFANNDLDRMKLIEEAALMRPSSAHPEVLNDVIDRVALKELEVILRDLQSIPIDQVGTHAKKITLWEPRLVELYKVAQTPKIRDFASQLLEYVLYQIKHNKDPDENGRTYYAKYVAYLNKIGIENADLPPEDAWLSPSAHAKYRMNSSLNVDASVLNSSIGTWTPLIGDYARSSSPEDKLYLLKKSYGIK